MQLARQLTGLTVIATVGSAATRDWLLPLGAHEVIDYRQPLADELRRIGLPHVIHVASLTHPDRHFAQIVECLAPQGKLALIDDPADHMAYLYRDMMLLHSDRQHEGLTDVGRAHELNPNHAQVLSLLGIQEAGAGDPALGLRCS